MKKTKELILKTGVRMFNEKGYDNVSVKDICTACGVTTGAFYHHFKSKYELLLDNRAQSIHSLLLDTMLQSDPVEQARALLIGYMQNFQEVGAEMQKHLLLGNLQNGCTFYNPHADPHEVRDSDRREIFVLQVKLVERCQELGRMSTAAPANELVKVYKAACFGALVHWSCSGGNYDLKKWAELYFNTIFLPKSE